MKFHIMYQKRHFFDVYCKLHIPLTCCALPKKAVKKLAKRHNATTLEELITVEKKEIRKWQNKEHVLLVIELINKVTKLLRVSLPSKDLYHKIRRSNKQILFILQLLNKFLVAPFYTVYHLIQKHKPLPSGFRLCYLLIFSTHGITAFII